MIATVTRKDIPEWARNRMLMYCPYCNWMIVDNSDTGVTTARRCINPKCPGHMSHKISYLADHFNVKGIGAKTAVDIINTYKLESHLQIIGMWFPEEKPLVSLPEYVDLACIEGYGSTSGNKELGEYSTPEDYFSSCKYPNETLLKNKAFLIDNAKYFRFKRALAHQKVFCMATGSFHGYSNRDDFFTSLNNVFGHVVNVVQVGARKTGVNFLIKEDDAVDHRKTAIAKECGIPIVTPLHFLALLNQQFPDVLELDKRKKEAEDARLNKPIGTVV